VHHDLPHWLLGLIAIRDLVIVTGAVAFHFNYAPLHAAPTWLGKITTAALLLMVLLLLWRNVSVGVPAWLIESLTYLCAGLLLGSGIDYVRRWSIKARKLRTPHA
jgi:cardiolipin synthase (CMP-forming)